MVHRVVGGAVKMIHSLCYFMERTMGYRFGGTCPGKDPQSLVGPGSRGDSSAGVRIGVGVRCIKRECDVRNDIYFRQSFTRGEEKEKFCGQGNKCVVRLRSNFFPSVVAFFSWMMCGPLFAARSFGGGLHGGGVGRILSNDTGVHGSCIDRWHAHVYSLRFRSEESRNLSSLVPPETISVRVGGRGKGGLVTR